MVKRIVLMVLVLLLAAALPAAANFEQIQDERLKGQILEQLKGDVNDLTLLRYDVPALAKSMAEGKALVPLTSEKGDVIKAQVDANSVQVRSKDHPGVAYVMTGKGEDVKAEKVDIPREQNYVIGDCGNQEKRDSRLHTTCGALSILDEKQTMVQGMFVDPELGTSFVEPVGPILQSDKYEGVHIAYNRTQTVPLALNCDLEEPGPAPGSRDFHASALVGKKTNVVLDCDGQFFSADMWTAWSRQDSIHLITHLVYGLLEPILDGVWGLTIPVIQHQGWSLGYGPTTTDKVALSNEISSSSYHIYAPFTNDDLHFFFVGYNVSGVYGRACGIGTAGGGIGGSAGKNHAYAEARTSQSLKTKWVVMAHEMGHLIGGVHGDGDMTGCLGGTSICGPSIMLAGGAGAPEGRQPYFSSANDANITAVIGAHLADW